ncbi:MAG: NADH-quinone oxidoreductase subunit C [Gammaproteobacteria bacterium]|nr:NADH-quinone oxidoreductase subunit C [Gammaproteobacteria bacterium]
MTERNQAVLAHAREMFGDAVTAAHEHVGELTLEIRRVDLLHVCRSLRDDPDFAYEQLIDVCGVDYLEYGRESGKDTRSGPRYAAVYHLLSLQHNHRLRLRTLLDDDMPLVASVVNIWNAANWFEREAFDLFGIVFEGHPDLRRILTDYGFVGHPFRKDFPLIGQVEMRYDPDKQRVVYQPVSIEPRTLVPRVIRDEGFAKG